ncbi:hypothetical protein CRX47_00325 [Clostridium sporogenes]|uniref:Uncharacterized protein n=1 Tax=Clostridium sporogenes TaxID=1509 RepID=A0ABX4KBC6_CLOSG|nr:hypothetical protein CRX47_00325 [Clostridium sporogenes]
MRGVKHGNGGSKAQTKKYRDFKEKVRIVQKYEKNYYIEDINGWLMLIRRN